jgi:uridine kinase
MSSPSSQIETFERLVDCVLDRPGPVRLVAVDGPGGAGKSTFADRFAAAAEGKAFVIRTDDFASAEEPINWWPRLLSEVIEPLVDGGSARFQRYDWSTRQLAEWVSVPPRPVVIIEGVSSSRSQWSRYLTFSIWIETETEVRLERGLARDGEDMLAQWRAWMAAEDRHFHRDGARSKANLLVDGDPVRQHDPETEVVVHPSSAPLPG